MRRDKFGGQVPVAKAMRPSGEGLAKLRWTTGSGICDMSLTWAPAVKERSRCSMPLFSAGLVAAELSFEAIVRVFDSDY